MKINNNGYDYVDLGLPSRTIWAACNVGAKKKKLQITAYIFNLEIPRAILRNKLEKVMERRNFIGLIISGIQAVIVRLLQIIQLKVLYWNWRMMPPM